MEETLGLIAALASEGKTKEQIMLYLEGRFQILSEKENDPSYFDLFEMLKALNKIS